MIPDNVVLLSFLLGVFFGYLFSLMQMETNKEKRFKKAIKKNMKD